MSSFKQRLGNALSTQLNFGPTTQVHSKYAHETSIGNAYADGLGSTSKKGMSQMNSSRLSGSTSGNVLSERVSRISEKINEIHTNIEKGKLGKLDEYERKVGTLEEKFDEAIDTSEKKFDIVDNQDRHNKDELLKAKREELAAREQEIAERFQLAERQRFEIEKKLAKVIDEKALLVQGDLQTESKNRLESIEHIKACLKSDFPKLEEMIRREFEEREEGDIQLDQHLNSEMQRLRETVDDEKKAREETEETMIEMFKDMINKIKSEIDTEKNEREQAEEALLSLLEETCAKLNKSVAL